MNKPHDVPEAKKKKNAYKYVQRTQNDVTLGRFEVKGAPSSRKTKKKKKKKRYLYRITRPEKNKIQTVFSSVSSTRCFQREATTAKRSRAFFVRALCNTPAPRVEEEGSVGRRTIDVAEGRDGKGKRKYQCSRWPARWVPNSF